MSRWTGACEMAGNGNGENENGENGNGEEIPTPIPAGPLGGLLNREAAVLRASNEYDDLGRPTGELSRVVEIIRVRIDERSAPGTAGDVPAKPGILEAVPSRLFAPCGADLEVGDWLEVDGELWRVLSLASPGGGGHHIEGWINRAYDAWDSVGGE